jgi:hypothetical protein
MISIWYVGESGKHKARLPPLMRITFPFARRQGTPKATPSGRSRLLLLQTRPSRGLLDFPWLVFKHPAASGWSTLVYFGRAIPRSRVNPAGPPRDSDRFFVLALKFRRIPRPRYGHGGNA